MITKLDDSVITDASTFVSFYAALVDRGSHLNGAGVIITFLSRTKWATTNPKRIYLFACGNCDNVVPVGHLPWKMRARSTLWNSNIDSWRSNSGIVLLLGAE
jgi:hypothetical protein